MTTVNLDTYEHRGRIVQAMPYTNWANHSAALMYWARKHGFDCYRESDVPPFGTSGLRTGTKVVIRLDAAGREEVVVRPECWVVFDLTHPRRTCRVQVWRGAEFAGAFTRRDAKAA
jgi:hypothetical protein